MKIIPLTQGKFAKVDDSDFDSLNQFKWCAHRKGRTFYAVRNARSSRKNPGSRGVLIMMHVEILGRKGGDHRDGDGLNNCRDNLRAATAAQNSANRRKQLVASSRFKGVSWYARYEKWRARITFAGECLLLGYFPTEIEAALSYNWAAKSFFGEFSKLNDLS